MTDTYNDTTGSRKKFLIPLVVLLLCAVSLTGAGYAYQSSVTLNGNSGEIDEYFTIDLYDGEGAVITAPVQVGDVDGLLVTTAKNVGGQTPGITGTFAKENFGVVLYQGKFRLDTDNLNATASANVVASAVTAVLESNTLYATVDQGVWTAADEQTPGAHKFTVADPEIELGNVAFFADEQCSVPAATFDVDTFYYFQIPVSDFTGTVTEDEVQGVAKITAAEDFAKAVVAALEIKFNFTLTATAVEDQCALTLNAMGGANPNQEFAIAVGDSVLENFAAPEIQGKTLQGFFTQTTDGTKVINADGSFVADVNGYTDAQSEWAAVGPVTLYAQWVDA